MHQPDGSRRCGPCCHRSRARLPPLLEPSDLHENRRDQVIWSPLERSFRLCFILRNTGSGSQIEMTSHLRRTSMAVVVCRWVTFGCTSDALNADVTFFEYGEDGSLLHKSSLSVKVPAVHFPSPSARRFVVRPRMVSSLRMLLANTQ